MGQPEADPWNEVAVAYGLMQSVITADGWRLTRFLDEGLGQMFDLKNDPGEHHNLYADPAFVAKRQELLERTVVAMARPRRVPQYRNMPLWMEKRSRSTRIACWRICRFMTGLNLPSYKNERET